MSKLKLVPLAITLLTLINYHISYGQCTVAFSQCPSAQTVYICNGQSDYYLTSYSPVTAYLNGNCAGYTLQTIQIIGPTLPTNIPPGSYLIGFYATTIDQNGNPGPSNQCTFQLNVVNDHTPPVFSNCPQNITINGTLDQNGACSGYGFWPSPIVSDFCSNFSVSSGTPCGSQFQEGTTNVIYTATDQNGNSSTCSFTVTVICTNSTNEQYEKMFDLNIYPNPIANILTLEFPEPLTSAISINVVNTMGQSLQRLKLDSGSSKCIFPLESIPPGLYILQLLKDDRVIQSEKFVKQ